VAKRAACIFVAIPPVPNFVPAPSEVSTTRSSIFSTYDKFDKSTGNV
jgi:hypothetical protein